ncbi:hypothetical protein [Escherichia coli]|uniref:hypothetical protein n=1 Tax=Escherichia coli TaxID=562 RepID=UPI001F4C441A|nr:hypothetical protein [Escherichia coli]UND23711.1 hypothetical protein H9207_05990 [Escherichia coli]
MSQQLKNIGRYRWILVFYPPDFKLSYCFYVGHYGSHNRLVAGSSPARATKSLFTYQEELRVQGVLDGGLYFMTNAISRKKCGGWFRMRAGVLVRGTPLQCIYPSVLIQKYLEKMPAMPSGQIAYMWN